MINKTKTDCCETTLCYYETATRPQFFHGMLLTDEHLRGEQDYHREALKRVNRNLWGSGIVSGLTVEKMKDLCIKINPGVALDCCGNLIEVCKCITLDLSKECEKNYGSDCPPRQSQGTEPDLKIKKYLVLRYVERETDLEPVLTPDTDCEPAGGKSKCSASKVQEGYCIELWDKCPCDHKDPGVEKDLITTLREAAENQELGSRNRIAPGGVAVGTAPAPLPTGPGGPTGLPEHKECTDLPLPYEGCGCCESAVGLAVLEINCTKKTIDRKVECGCRRYVISPRQLNWIFSTLRHEYKPSEIKSLSDQIGHRASANMLAAAMTYEAQKATTGPATPTPGTVNPTPGTVNPTPGTVNPAPGTVNPTPGTVNPTPGTVNPTPGTVTPAPGTVNPTPGTVNPTPGTVTPAPGTVNPAPGTVNPATGVVNPQSVALNSAPGPSNAKIEATDAKVESLKNKLKTMSAEITSLKKLTRELKRQATTKATPAATPPVKP